MSNNIGGTKIPGLTYPVLDRSSENYIDVDFLEDYVIILSLDSSWIPGSDLEAKGSAVLRSQIYIESLYYQGSKFWVYQVLQWPRDGVLDKNGWAIDAEQTPYDIFNAVAEGAFNEYKTPGILQPNQTRQDSTPLKRSKVVAGSVESEEEWDTSKVRSSVESVDTLTRLTGYLSHWITSYGVSIPLIRT